MELKIHRVNLYDHFLRSSNLPELLTSFFGFLLRSARRSWAQVPFLRHSLCTLRQWKWRELLSLLSELTNQQTLYQIRTNQLKEVFRATISGVGWKFTSTPSMSCSKKIFFSFENLSLRFNVLPIEVGFKGFPFTQGLIVISQGVKRKFFEKVCYMHDQ